MSERYALPRVFYTGDLKPGDFPYKVRIDPVGVRNALRDLGFSSERIQRTEVVVNNHSESGEGQTKISGYEDIFRKTGKTSRSEMPIAYCNVDTYAKRYVGMRDDLYTYAALAKEYDTIDKMPRDEARKFARITSDREVFYTQRLLNYLHKQGDTERINTFVERLVARRIRTEITRDIVSQIREKPSTHDLFKWDNNLKRIFLAANLSIAAELAVILLNTSEITPHSIIPLVSGFGLNISTAIGTWRRGEMVGRKRLRDSINESMIIEVEGAKKWSGMVVFDKISPSESN